jgi:selenocysteine lyase/cysteine desulfurase
MARLRDVGATVVTPSDGARRAGIVTVRVKNPERASANLARSGIVCALREGAIRLSPHLYSTSEDVGRAMEVLVREV